jgi:hypothetical protein
MKLYRTILSLGFFLLTLISSTNFMVGLHFCGDEIAVAMFTKAECGMEANIPPCHRPQHACCDDELIVHEAQDFKNTFNEFQFQPQLIAELVLPTVLSEVITKTSSQFDLSVYHPPLRATDLTVSHQVFRI